MTENPSPPLDEFETHVLAAFQTICESPIAGASAFEVTGLLRERFQMPADRTVVDTHRAMQRLRDRRLL